MFTEYLWQSDKFIVVTKAAKAVGTKELGYCRFTQEKQPKRERLEMNVNVGKTVPISFNEVEQAYAIARQGGKATGIDRESWRT